MQGGLGFDPWSGNAVPHATTKDPMSHGKDRRSHMVQPRPSTAKQINIGGEGAVMNVKVGNTLAVQWLRLCALIAWVCIESLVSELRSQGQRQVALSASKLPFGLGETHRVVLMEDSISIHPPQRKQNHKISSTHPRNKGA